MTYHNHTIKKVPTDLGESQASKNFTYEIYNKEGKRLNVALTLSTAKEYIDSGYDSNVL